MPGTGPDKRKERDSGAASLRSRQQRLRQSMEEVLKKYLSTAQLQSLRDLSGSFDKLPFQFDRESGRFEIADSWTARLIEWEETGLDPSPTDPGLAERAGDASSQEPELAGSVGDLDLPAQYGSDANLEGDLELGHGPDEEDGESDEEDDGWEPDDENGSSEPDEENGSWEPDEENGSWELDEDWDQTLDELDSVDRDHTPPAPPTQPTAPVSWSDLSESGLLSPADRASLAALEAGLQESAIDSAVDLLCRACDVLTAHQDELDLELLERQPEGGRFTFEFDFAQPDAHHQARIMDDETGEIFERLLRQSDGWSVHSEPLLGGRIVQVTVGYRSEAEFARIRDHLNWLLDLAARQRQRRPFEGTRLS